MSDKNNRILTEKWTGNSRIYRNTNNCGCMYFKKMFNFINYEKYKLR